MNNDKRQAQPANCTRTTNDKLPREASNLQSQRLLVIVGPTAVGKSAIAIELAERLDGEIISADSRYLYRGLDVGTAKPSLADRARAPHHLIDVTDPDKPWSLSEYRAAADELINAINGRRRLPLLVGGTGQYIRAVLEGWTIPPRAADPAL
ncbi:MAG: isopentenyl transferase family protein, partial [Chloroflexota bacterium]